jgi:hypothetical protein
MEVGDVSLVASSGAVLSMSEKAALQSSASILKKQYRFGSVKLFGKIKGKTNDYLIAIGEEGSSAKKYFYRCAQRRLNQLFIYSTHQPVGQRCGSTSEVLACSTCSTGWHIVTRASPSSPLCAVWTP